MSNIVLHVPDDGWFRPGSNIEPEVKFLCVVIHAYGDQTPGIYQFRKADWLYPYGDYFLDVAEKWRMDAYGCGEDWEPGFATMDIISYWKPLGLPADTNKLLLKTIESWFED